MPWEKAHDSIFQTLYLQRPIPFNLLAECPQETTNIKDIKESDLFHHFKKNNLFLIIDKNLTYQGKNVGGDLFSFQASRSASVAIKYSIVLTNTHISRGKNQASLSNAITISPTQQKEFSLSTDTIVGSAEVNLSAPAVNIL